jgi:hypothetical protein
LFTLLSVLLPLFIIFALPYTVVNGDAEYVQFKELFSVAKWQENAKRRGSLDYLGPLGPAPDNIFRSSCVDLFVRVGFASGSALAARMPLLRALLCLLLALVWLLVDHFKPSYLDPGFAGMITNLRIFTALAMFAATIVVVTKNSLVPKLVLLVGFVWLVYSSVRCFKMMKATLQKNWYRILKENESGVQHHSVEDSLYLKQCQLPSVSETYEEQTQRQAEEALHVDALDQGLDAIQAKV